MIKSEHIRLLLIMAVLVGLLFLTGDRQRPVKLIVPFSAGGGSDTAGRLLQLAVTDGNNMENPLVIINVPGGGGTIGSRRAKTAPPDGYTLLLLHEGMFTAKQSGQAPYGAEAFTPVAAYGRTGTFVAVADESPYKNMNDLAEFSQANPKKLTFACNLGAPAHFVGMQIQNAVGGEFSFVPSGGGALRSEDLKGGQVECTIFSSSEFHKYGSDGKIRALAYLSKERHPEFPDIPTAKEQGIDLLAATTQFIWAPEGTPDDIVNKLASGFKEALAAPKIVAMMEEQQIEPVFYQGEELAELVADREKTIGTLKIETPTVFPYFPHIVAIICAGLVIGIFIASRRTPKSPETDDSSWGGSAMHRVIFAALALVFALALALNAPFVAATSVFTFCSCCLLTAKGELRPKRLVSAAALSLGLAFGCFYIFVRVLSIDLP